MSDADVDAVCAVEVSAYGHPWSRGNFCDSIRQGHVCEVLMRQVGEESHLAGYWVALQILDEMHLLNLTVAPAYQGQGMGSVLLERFETQARQRGIRTLWLEVRAGNDRAQRLYGRRGFVTAGTRKGYYPLAGARREDALVMCRFLRDTGAA
jgi:[ribosomal protein S18]-alanine N-acetyltransferase